MWSIGEVSVGPNSFLHGKSALHQHFLFELDMRNTGLAASAVGVALAETSASFYLYHHKVGLTSRREVEVSEEEAGDEAAV